MVLCCFTSSRLCLVRLEIRPIKHILRMLDRLQKRQYLILLLPHPSQRVRVSERHRETERESQVIHQLMSLCRQAGVDEGLLLSLTSNVTEARLSVLDFEVQPK
ncbi:unnamed protein product [Arctogadus glacialis]